MEKMTWKQKIGAMLLFCIAGISTNDDAPAPQVRLEERVVVRDKVKAAVDQQEDCFKVYAENMKRVGRGGR